MKRINLPCVRCLTAPCAVASRRESDCRVSSVSRHRVPVHLDAKPRLLVLYRGIHKAASPKHHKLHSAAHAKWHKKRTTRAKKESICAQKSNENLEKIRQAVHQASPTCQAALNWCAFRESMKFALFQHGVGDCACPCAGATGLCTARAACPV